MVPALESPTISLVGVIHTSRPTLSLPARRTYAWLGRLGVFPANDSSVVQNLAPVDGAAPLAVRTVLDTPGPEQDMLYYHLPLARLETLGDVGTAISSPYEAGALRDVGQHA